jgi:hypothetical protein
MLRRAMSPARLGVQSTVENQRVRIKCRRWDVGCCACAVSRWLGLV